MNSAPSVTRSRVALCGLAALLLAACSGNDGGQGPAGAPGTPGVATASSAETLSVTVDKVTIASPPVVTLTLTNEDGVRFTGMTSSNIRFTIAKLVPENNGVPAHWQNYINKTETPTVGPGTDPKTQATYDSGGTLTNNGDGSYTYTFGKDITNVTSPIAVAYEPTLTHRIGMQISGTGVPITNATYDWRPSDGSTTGIEQLDVVKVASCNECHGKLAVHGGSRVDTKYCVTCHNPGSTDANTGNTVDFKVMIHKIHDAQHLPSYVNNGTHYEIYGYNNAISDFTEVTYPQDIRNCTKCHNEYNTDTPQAHLWHDLPSTEACGSCHDNVDFTTGVGHDDAGGSGIVAQDGQCTICHGTNSSGGSFAGTVQNSHVIPAKVNSAKFQYTIVSVTQTAPGQFPVVTYEVTDPTNGNAPYDLTGDPAWTQTGSGTSRLAIDLGWSNGDYENLGNGSSSTPSSAISLDALRASTGNNAAPVANGDGTYTVTSLRAVPASGVTGSGVAALEGHPAADYDGNGTLTDRVPVTTTLKYFAITDATPVARRTVVDIAKCDKCHDQLSLHGNNRTDEPRVCVICHNADNTDIARRGGTTGIDGLKEQSIDFKRLVHAIHASAKRENPFIVYGFGGSVNNFSEVTFPGVLNNCATCHAGTTYQVPLKAEVLATTVDSGASIPDPTDDTNVTPTAAVCSSCHDSGTAQTHMEQNGASFVMTGDPGTYNETCEVCHAAGRIADVTVVHEVH